MAQRRPAADSSQHPMKGVLGSQPLTGLGTARQGSDNAAAEATLFKNCHQSL
jgi:hypothetical protein